MMIAAFEERDSTLFSHLREISRCAKSATPSQSAANLFGCKASKTFTSKKTLAHQHGRQLFARQK